MKKVVLLVLLVLLAQVSGRAVQLNFSTSPSTNNAMVYWYPQTNFQVLRYNLYWTPLTNTDVGTNWPATTNWVQFANVGPDTTNAPLWAVPTNSYVTFVAILPGGRYTQAAVSNNAANYPYFYCNGFNFTMTNQLLSP